MAFQRQGSKYRHMRGNVVKRELWYPDITPGVYGDSNPIAASAKFIAVAWSATGGGSVAIIPMDRTGKRQEQLPLIHAHAGKVVDVVFNPLNDNVLATASEDCSVKVWEIPEGGLAETLSTPIATFKGHSKKVNMVKFHPTADGVVATASVDKTVRVWDVATSTEKCAGAFGDAVYSIDWNYNGSLLAVTSQDKKIRIFDPRAGVVVQEGNNFEGVKPSFVCWLGEQQRVATTGFSKFRERKFSIWDATDLSKPLHTETIDSSTGVLIPLYDNDARILFIAGKGDGNIRSYDILDNKPFISALNPLTSSDAQSGVAMVPKRGLRVMECEVNRILKLGNSDIIPVSYEVPRKSHREFADDLFPRTPGTQPALSAQEWFGGENRNPVLVSLDPSSSSSSYLPPRDDDQGTSSGPVASSSTSVEASSASSDAHFDESPYPKASVSGGRYRSGDYVKEAAKVKPEDDPDNYYVPKTLNIVRTSKLRHVTAKPWEQSKWFTNLKMGRLGSDSMALTANATYFAIPWVGSGGQVAVIPLDQPGKAANHVGAVETGSEVMAIQLHTAVEDILFTGLDNAQIKIWKVPQDLHKRGPREPNHTQEEAVLRGHKRRLQSVDLHPLNPDILVTSAMDLTVRLWDITQNAQKVVIGDGGEHGDQIQSVVFSYDGGMMATSCKDKTLRLWDPRNQSLAGSTADHQSPNKSRLAWLGDSPLVFSVGFSKSSEREFNIFDTRNLSSPVTNQIVGVGSGVYEPFFDEDLWCMSLVAMGDSSIKFYELESSAPYAHYLTESQSPRQQAAIARLPKTCCNVAEAELAQYVKLSGSTLERFAVKVPRTRLEYFQDDLYPPTRSAEPAISPDDYFAGRTARPRLISLQPEGMKPLSEAPKIVRKVRKFESVEQETDADQLKEIVVNKFHERMMDFKEGKGDVLPQDLNEGVDEDEWSD